MPLVKEGYSLRQIYKYYLRVVLFNGRKFCITERQYKDIVFLFNKKMSKLLLEGKVIGLPHGLSEMRIKKFPFHKCVPGLDYGEYNRTGKKLLHLNEHSDGFRAGWYWRKSKVLIVGKSAFSFVPTWTNKRALAQVMKRKNGHKAFFE